MKNNLWIKNKRTLHYLLENILTTLNLVQTLNIVDKLYNKLLVLQNLSLNQKHHNINQLKKIKKMNKKRNQSIHQYNNIMKMYQKCSLLQNMELNLCRKKLCIILINFDYLVTFQILTYFYLITHSLIIICNTQFYTIICKFKFLKSDTFNLKLYRFFIILIKYIKIFLEY